MTTEIQGLRTQILANAKILLQPKTGACAPNLASQSTLLPSSTDSSHGMEVVVFSTPEKTTAVTKEKYTPGTTEKYTAAIMLGLKPAIEGDTAPNPEAAIRKLFLATCELLKKYMPKVGAHQRNLHGGGVYDDDMISTELLEARKEAQKEAQREALQKEAQKEAQHKEAQQEEAQKGEAQKDFEMEFQTAFA